MDDDSDRFQNQAIDASGGKFEVHNVIPGAYNLFVLTNDGNVLPSIPLDVVDRNIENVSATVESGVDLHGRVTLDGGKPGDRFSKNSIQLATLDELPGVGRQRFPINPDTETGEFVLRNLLPGQICAPVGGVPGSGYLRRGRQDGAGQRLRLRLHDRW